MATRRIRIRGYNHAVNTATTVTFDGVEVFSGALSAEVIDESDIPVAVVEFEYNNADDTQETEHSLRIEVTAGQITVGNIWAEATRDSAIVNSYPENEYEASPFIINGDSNGDPNGPPVTFPEPVFINGVYYYAPANMMDVYDENGPESVLPERINILINDAEPISVGHDVNQYGYEFLLSAGDTFACTVRVPAILAAYVAP